MSGFSTHNSTDSNDGRPQHTPEIAQALNLFTEVRDAWAKSNDPLTTGIPYEKSSKAEAKHPPDFLDFNAHDIYEKAVNSLTDNTSGPVDYSQYTDNAGNVFVRNAATGSESILQGENGPVIAERNSNGIISDATGSWSADAQEHALTLIHENADHTNTTYTIERNSDGTFLVRKYDSSGNLNTEQITPSELHDLLRDTSFKTLDNSYDPSSNIASFRDSYGEMIMFDFGTGALGIGGFGPGHYVFNENGSMTMPNGDVVTRDGTIIKGSDFYSHLKSTNDPAAAEAIQAEAQNYMSNVLAKIASKSVTAEDFSALMNCYSALGSVGMFSAAASIMQGAVGSVMNEASNLMSRINTALGMNVTDSTGLAAVADDIYTNAYVSAAQHQNPAVDATALV
jgi:hypothetical protein